MQNKENLPITLAALLCVAGLAHGADPAAGAREMPKLPAVPQATVDAAINARLIRFDRTIKGGAHTDGSWGGGGSIILALAAAQGNTSADARLLEQIRFNLQGDNSITANGGYPTQHERHVTGMYALIRHVPRVWDQLTAKEQHAVDLVMKAALVGAAFTTSDTNHPAGKKPIALDADTNLSRGWNPNFQEGMVGMMIVGTVYFGGGEAAQQVLDTYDHDAFIADLWDAGLTNIYQTFTWKQANPTSAAPDGKAITEAIKNYRFMDVALTDPMQLYYMLTVRTYGAKVNAGLNDGAGLNGSGMIASGADDLPNKGKPGMLLEFASRDAGGDRSSITYAYDGFRPNLTNQLVLIAGGYWEKGAKANDCVALLDVGITDLFYKLDHGYKNYSKGKGSTDVFDSKKPGWNFTMNRSLWDDVLKPWHASQSAK